MKNTTFLLSIFLCICSFSLSTSLFAQDYSYLVSKHSDSGFGGFYLNIEMTMRELGISRLHAHEIQNQLRDELERESGSFSRIEQTPFLKKAISNAVYAVTRNKAGEGFFKPLKFQTGEFVIVLDLDETVLTHWYRYGGVRDSEVKGSFKHKVRDTVPDTVDRKTGNSHSNPKMHFSPNLVQLRPGIEEFTKIISKTKGFKGFIIFTAKEDRSAWDVYKTWKSHTPLFFSHLLGFYTRNYLRFDSGVSKPSKDLRIFDGSLKHVFLLDDNESRVMQKDLNYRIPKFNADAYLESISKGGNRSIKGLNEDLLPSIARKVAICSIRAHEGKFKRQVTNCLRENLGVLSSQGKHKEIDLYYEANKSEHPLDKKQLYQIFHQPFHPAFSKVLTEKFPKFDNFHMLE